MANIPLPEFKKLPYETADQLISAFENGVQFLFIRSDQHTCNPVIKMKKDGSRVRLYDYKSINGDSVTPEGRGTRNIYLVLAAAQPAHALKAPIPKAPRPSLLSDQITESDKPGIAAMPKPAPITPAPSFMVAQPKSGAGLLTIHNPDDRITLIAH